MDANGVLWLQADRLSQAVERAEDLGCRVLQAKTESTGEHAVRVKMGLSAANAVAHAVLRKELSFRAA